MLQLWFVTCGVGVVVLDLWFGICGWSRMAGILWLHGLPIYMHGLPIYIHGLPIPIPGLPICTAYLTYICLFFKSKIPKIVSRKRSRPPGRPAWPAARPGPAARARIFVQKS